MADEATVGNKTANTIVCYAPMMVTTNGIWQGDNPLNFSLPLFILQLTLVLLLTRLLLFLLKPLRQPRVIAEILGGIILGPSLLGLNPEFSNTLFPLRSVMVLETMANLGLLYFLFLVGVEMDISVIIHTGKKSLIIALSGILLPFIVGCSFSFLIQPPSALTNQATFVLFLGVAISVTAFPVLARILADLKLINTDLGRTALSAALINDICAWVLLAVAIALADKDSSSMASLWVILSSAAFVGFCVFALRPALGWLVRRTPEGEGFSDFNISVVLTGVMVCGFVTDAIGTHSVFGAFVFGLVIPEGPLAAVLIEKLEDFVSGLLMPLFFAISGLKTNVAAIRGAGTWAMVGLMVLLACVGKVVGTLLVCIYYRMPVREGVTLGFLMNTKGLVEMIVLNVGRDQNVLDEQSFAIMVIVAVMMTIIITPIVTTIYRPAKRFVAYKRRTVQTWKGEGELRILTCVHTPRNVPTLINLLEASNPTKRSPISAYVLHLVELTGRASAMLIVHSTRKSGQPAVNRTQAQSDHIIGAFENFEQHVENVSVHPLTAISPYSTMHEDVCNLARDKRVALIILPFHKQQTVDGGMETTNPAFRLINQNVLNSAPSSVAILVDRGLTHSSRLSSNQAGQHVAVLFFGGGDDREALAYGWRMSEREGIRLTVMRFVPGEEVGSAKREGSEDPRMLTVVTDREREREMDEEYISEFKGRNTGEEGVVYVDKVVDNGEETVSAIRSIHPTHDLFIVGRGRGTLSPLTAGLTDWSECPELGAIGDLLASSDFSTNVSVLVVQQYAAQFGPAAPHIPPSPTLQEQFSSTPLVHRF